MNTQIEIFERNLCTLINQAQLPVGVVKLIIQKTLNDINNLYKLQLIEEYKQQQEKQSQSTEESISDSNQQQPKKFSPSQDKN